jgi:hypothetical protein
VGFPPLVQGIYSVFGFEFSHGVGDPLLQVIGEPRLYTIRKPDRVTLPEGAGRRPVGALEDARASFLQVFPTNKLAQILSSVKLQVQVDVSERELFLFPIASIDYIHHLLHLLRVVRVVLADGGQELLHQDVVDLGFFAP